MLKAGKWDANKMVWKSLISRLLHLKHEYIDFVHWSEIFLFLIKPLGYKIPTSK